MHHLHDGPIYISKFKAKPLATLAALQWAAERAGMSYGIFTLNLTDDDQRRIQLEYEAYQREWRNELAARARMDTTPIPEGYILTDEDV